MTKKNHKPKRKIFKVDASTVSKRPAKKKYVKEATDKRFLNSFVQSEAEELKAEISKILDIRLDAELIKDIDEGGYAISGDDAEMLNVLASRIPLSLQVDILSAVTDRFKQYLYIKKKD